MSFGAVPSIFPNCPAYLSQSRSTKRNSRENLLMMKECQNIKRAIEKSAKEFEEQMAKDRFSSLIELSEKLKIEPPWKVVELSNKLNICYIEDSASTGPHIKAALCIREDMLLDVFIQSVKLTRLGKLQLPVKINTLSQIYEICETTCSLKSFASTKVKKTSDLTLQLVFTLLTNLINNSEKNTALLLFITEQLQLMNKPCSAYSSEFLVFSSIFHNISPSAYRFLRTTGNIILPCLSTIRKITLQSTLSPANEQSHETFLFYINQKFELLNSNDKTVSLLVDEIHLSSYFDYKGGGIVGAAYNTINAATSAFAFMISSIFSNYKDVIHVLPACKMDAQALFEIITKTVKSLEKVGFQVISVITDNNAINRKAMALFASPPELRVAYPHPCNHTRPLFFILDSVHILKCIRNNWLNQKLDGKCLTFPHFQFGDICTSNNGENAFASFLSIKELHRIESESLVTYAYRLSAKALQPSNLERQNVKLVLQIFSNYVSHALRELGEKYEIPHYLDTAAFIEIVTTWWNIVNVKTPHKTIRLNDDFQQPITSPETKPKLFLKEFLNWLLQWDQTKQCSGKFTKETYTAIVHTSNALLKISEYCLHDLGAKYVLLGKFQTDCLEARFGQYRQLAGGKYDVSLRQVFECEKKIRLLSFLKLSIHGQEVTLNDFSLNWDAYEIASNIYQNYSIQITAEEIHKSKEKLPVLTYIAGYCCYSINKKLKCIDCKEYIESSYKSSTNFQTSLIRGLSRGGLLYRSQEFVDIVLICYIAIIKLVKIDTFYRASSQRKVAVNSCLAVLEAECMLHNNEANFCTEHNYTALVEMTVWVCTNVLLNNLCFKKNDDLCTKRLSKKRKLGTLK